MAYLFTCPHCQTKTQVDDQYSGQSGQCVTCGHDIQLPDFGTETSAKVGSPKNPRILFLGVLGGILFLLLGSFLVAIFRFGGDTITQINTSRDQTASIRNLEKIAAALNAYANDHGTYPPPVVRDANGKPLHSWRVLILPYLDENDLYDRYNLDLPFDHPENLPVAYEVPAAYRHPNAMQNGLFSESAYYLITGPETLFPPEGPLRPDQVTDGAAKTILVVEGNPDTLIDIWTEPIDLDVTKMQGRINGPTADDPGKLMDSGAAIVTVDERGHFLPNSTPATTFQSLVSPAGGEPLRDDTLD